MTNLDTWVELARLLPLGGRFSATAAVCHQLTLLLVGFFSEKIPLSSVRPACPIPHARRRANAPAKFRPTVRNLVPRQLGGYPLFRLKVVWTGYLKRVVGEDSCQILDQVPRSGMPSRRRTRMKRKNDLHHTFSSMICARA